MSDKSNQELYEAIHAGIDRLQRQLRVAKGRACSAGLTSANESATKAIGHLAMLEAEAIACSTCFPEIQLFAGGGK